MRSHGVSNFPDPNSEGQFTHLPNPDLPQFESAQKDCASVVPPAPTTAQEAEMQTPTLKYSACMRSHGVPNFPDPTFRDGKPLVRLSGIDPNSPRFQSAQKDCQNNSSGTAP
jgi:hypothetical protein